MAIDVIRLWLWLIYDKQCQQKISPSPGKTFNGNLKKNSINVGHRLHYWYVTILLYYITILQYGNGDAVVIDNRDYYYCRMAAIGYITIYDYD